MNDIPKRFYVTCNPGGVGHRWVKRLFIDREFISGRENPEEDEDPDDYTFIPATVEDNAALLKASPGYLRMLSSMPENLRRAYRYGEWDALGGSYFPELSEKAHVVEPFASPAGWKRYRAFDYGLDMFACAWFAVDEAGRSWMYREYSKSGLIVKDAAKAMLERTLPGERIEATFAPPDMWSRQKDSGKTMAELFFEGGAPIVRADNSRVQGHMMIKEMLAKRPDGRPSLFFFSNCRQTIDDLKDIQADENDPNDCAAEPHEVTHRVDAVRYYCISRVLSAERPERPGGDADGMDYDEYMAGGGATASYIRF